VRACFSSLYLWKFKETFCSPGNKLASDLLEFLSLKVPHMLQIHQTDAKTIELTKIAATEEDVVLIRQHVREVIEGTAFRGSQRSAQFLKYVVEQAIAGHFDALKERVIGIELFGRAPTYDTGDDAIVRVTASDVRKRILQHYGRYGTTSGFRITLPTGSYVPEITRDAAHEIIPTDTEAQDDPAKLQIDTGISEALVSGSAETHLRGGSRQWMVVCLIVTLMNLVLSGFFWYRFSYKSNPVTSTLPWSALFNSPHALQVITSDPDIAEIQGLTGHPISVSDYANHNYIPDPDKLTPEMNQISYILLRGNKAALVDAPIAVSIAELAHSSAKKIDMHPARSLQIQNLQTDDNFILLGSPRSNPWSAFFSDELNFRFVYDNASGQEIIRNLHPGPHEQAEYVPTALGGATGQSYAVVAFVRNPDQNGQVLLLAGANAEGTEAAGKLVTDLPRLSTVLTNCGVSPSGPLEHFEMLLRLSMMAGSPTSVNIEACHALSGGSLH
jgi:hypothetical protein